VTSLYLPLLVPLLFGAANEQVQKIERKGCIGLRRLPFDSSILKPSKSRSLCRGILEIGGAVGLEHMGGGIRNDKKLDS
jgi:hypothetical protein